MQSSGNQFESDSFSVGQRDVVEHTAAFGQSHTCKDTFLVNTVELFMTKHKIIAVGITFHSCLNLVGDYYKPLLFVLVSNKL